MSVVEWALPWIMRREGEASSLGDRRACRREGERARTVMVNVPEGAARHRLRVERAMPPVAEMKRIDLVGWDIVVVGSCCWSFCWTSRGRGTEAWRCWARVEVA